MPNISTVVKFSVPSDQDVALLRAHCMQPVILKDIDGNVIRSIQPPESGWNVARLDALQVTDDELAQGYDVYLKDVWFGSSEM